MPALDLHYIDPRLVALYDLDSGWSSDRDYYFAQATTPGTRILDLGCGTGLLATAYARQGHPVTGVDPSAQMLQVARSRPGGDSVRWIQAAAQSFEASGSYDLVVMTGHAFQVLLTEADAAAVFARIRNSLVPGGRWVFESRNPAYDWAGRWNYTFELQTPDGSVCESRRLLRFDQGLLHFELSYDFREQRLISTSCLRFWRFDEIVAGLASAGLAVFGCQGD